MKYIFSLLALAGLLFVGCGGGGTKSTAESGSTISASPSRGTTGANYLFNGILKVSWQGKVSASSVVLSNVNVLVEGKSYPVGFTTSQNIPKGADGFSATNQLNIPFEFIKTLPFEKNERLGTVHIDYIIGKDTKTARIQCRLPGMPSSTDGDGDGSDGEVTISKISASEKTPYSSQSIVFAGQLKKSGKVQANKAIKYTVLTPTFMTSPANGTINTDENGLFNANLQVATNPLQESRDIAILFAHGGATAVWKVAQAASPTASDFTIKSIFKQDSITRTGGSVKYIGTLQSGDTGVANQTLSYQVIPSDAANSGTITTDAFGNFNIDLNIAQNATGGSRDINVVVSYRAAKDTWKITQSSQEDTTTYTIDIPSIPTVFANGGEFKVSGILRDDKNQAVSGETVSYDILTPSYVIETPQTLTTDSNGKFTLSVVFRENISTSGRNVPIVFAYKNTIKNITIAQNSTQIQSEYRFVEYLLQNSLYKGGGRMNYFGKLTKHGEALPNATISYTVVPEGTVLQSSGSVTTDAEGNFRLSVDVNQNNSGKERTIGVVMTHADQSQTWIIKQDFNEASAVLLEQLSAQTEVQSSEANATFFGKLTENGTAQGNKTVNYSVLPTGATTAATGTTTTDTNGIISFRLPVNANAETKDRKIATVFSYENASLVWELVQKAPQATSAEFTITVSDPATVGNTGGQYSYFGKLQDGNKQPVSNTDISYRILNNVAVTAPAESGTITTDANGDFTLSGVTYGNNTATTERTIPITFSYRNAFKTVTVTQNGTSAP